MAGKSARPTTEPADGIGRYNGPPSGVRQPCCRAFLAGAPFRGSKLPHSEGTPFTSFQSAIRNPQFAIPLLSPAAPSHNPHPPLLILLGQVAPAGQIQPLLEYPALHHGPDLRWLANLLVCYIPA